MPPSVKSGSNVSGTQLRPYSAKDMSGWKDLFVPAKVLQALNDQGFDAPTPIQSLSLPPAIRDRMDIIGAAETVSSKLA